MDKLTRIACGIVYRDTPDGRETLLIKRNAEGGYGYRWEFPKGHVDPGEDVETALKREIKEETNLTIDNDYDLLEINKLHQCSGEIVEMHIYSCKISGNQTAKISHEHIDLEWTKTTVGYGILPFFDRLITKVLGNNYVVESYLEYLLEKPKRASRHKVTRQTKITRSTSQMSTSMARKRGDSLYKRMVFYREKYYYYREMIRKKYSARNRARARK